MSTSKINIYKTELRPMMRVSEMIPYLKKKNIKFDYISEKDAIRYLKEIIIIII